MRSGLVDKQRLLITWVETLERLISIGDRFQWWAIPGALVCVAVGVAIAFLGKKAPIQAPTLTVDPGLEITADRWDPIKPRICSPETYPYYMHISELIAALDAQGKGQRIVAFRGVTGPSAADYQDV